MVMLHCVAGRIRETREASGTQREIIFDKTSVTSAVEAYA